MNNNIMAKTVKEAKADIFLRDTDTQSLFNNSGVLLYKYYHEWNDCYNSTTGDTAQINGEIYDEDSGTYKPNCPSGYDPVFNGRLSALWDNLSYCFSDRIKTMYQKMRENGLSYKDMLTKYKDFWKYWCENLYNADAFGYANTNNFTKAYGDKVQVVDYFFSKRQRYLDSKYNTGLSTSNNLRFRLYEKGNGFALKYYQAIYSNLHWGSRIDSQRNIKPGEYSYMPFLLDNPQNATFDIDDADLITELSTYTKNSSGYTIGGLEGLGDFYFDQNMILLKRLTKFIMNYTSSSPNTLEEGTAFDLSGMKMLKQVIVRNVTSLSKSIVLSSDLLEEVDFTGTPITGLSTPPTDMLTKLILPDTIKTLNLVGYTNLQPSGLQVGGYSNIETLDIEDCPNLDSYSICKACYDAGAKLSNVTITDVDWTIDEVDMLLFLTKKNTTLQGVITIPNSINLTLSQVDALRKAFGDITSKSNSLYISFKITSVNKVSIVGEKNIPKVGEYQYSITCLPTSGNNVDNVKWYISSNEFAELKDKYNGIITINKIGTPENDDKVILSVEVTLLDGQVLTAMKEIYLYPHKLALGDILFSDGSISDELKSGLTPVGICFYINPKNRNQGLFVSTNPISPPYNSWGLMSLSNNTNAINNIVLADNPNLSVYDIPLVPNVNPFGITISDANIRDESNTDNDGFREYSANSWGGCIGFTSVTSNMVSTIGEYLDAIGLEVGDTVSQGFIQSLYIIRHRDIILRDSSVNEAIPEVSNEETLYDNLTECIDNIVKENGNQTKYAQYYFPAASYCNAYEPKITSKETLKDELKAGNWYLPSQGEIARLCWFNLKGKDYAEWAIFSNAANLGVFTLFTGYLYSSAELPITSHICSFNMSNGQSSYSSGLNNINKANFSIIARICPVIAYENKY